ncbi:MAG: hypothetical protein K0Q77_413 [Anaerosporomusa subterranea]|jgi:ACS family D-galactonate transporter-like MFS transporter|nr:hypothetical protein [Anaerosporomusa subterranea]
MEVNTSTLEKPTRARYLILLLVCLMTAANFIGRTNLAVAAPYMQQELGITPAMMGIVFSAFNWTYTLMQLPGGWIVDRFGSRKIYSATMFLWSSFIGLIGLASNVTALVVCRLSLGICGAPTYIANSRIVTAWFPAKERGLAIGAYIGSQHIGLAFLTPLITWLIVAFSWRYVFYITGILGVGLAVIWYLVYREPANYCRINALELTHICDGEALNDSTSESQFSGKDIRQMLKHRQLWGMFIGHFAMNSTLYFFITWFPSYLVNAKGLTLIAAGFYAAAPFLAAMAGVTLGGKWSDWMLSRGYSLGMARKMPMAVGLSFSCCIMLANYTSDIWLIILIMSVGFFGQGIGTSCGWALLSDIVPKQLIGISSGIYNFAANLGGCITPLVIGFIVQNTQSYELGLAFVSFIALLGVLAYVFMMGRPYRMELRQDSIIGSE